MDNMDKTAVELTEEKVTAIQRNNIKIDELKLQVLELETENLDIANWTYRTIQNMAK